VGLCAKVGSSWEKNVISLNYLECLDMVVGC
jgi:hypothetical protein